MKIWDELEIDNLIETSDKFLIRCLLKLHDLNLLEVPFLQSLYNYYQINWGLTPKQLDVFRDMINYKCIQLFTKVANKEEIIYADFYEMQLITCDYDEYENYYEEPEFHF